jgi:hypothetical protein
MRRTIGCLATLAFAAGSLSAQTAETSAEESEAVEVYTGAIAALLGAPGSGTAHLAGRIRGEGARIISSPVPDRVAERLREDGYRIEIAELAENGLWQFPRGQLFLMLREIEWWPGRKIAVLSIDVGNNLRELREVGFKFKKENQRWVLIEKGPAEGGG